MNKKLIYLMLFLVPFVFIACGEGGQSTTNPVGTDNGTSSSTNVVSPVKRTGQTRSFKDYGVEVFNNSMRDDGYHQEGVEPIYTRDAEMVTDHLTGLVWQDDRKAYSVKETWQNASSSCAKLTLSKYSDWRLPTRRELRTLSDFGRSKPAINPVFRNINASFYWTSTSYDSGSNDAWSIIFYSGNSKRKAKTNTYGVRCVRTGDLGINLAENGNFKRNDKTDIVTDSISKLEWLDKSSYLTRWENAINYCETSSVDGGGWRMPNINELETLFDSSRYSPAISQQFTNIKPSSYWASTSFHYANKYSWSVNFSSISETRNCKIFSHYIICVR